VLSYDHDHKRGTEGVCKPVPFQRPRNHSRTTAAINFGAKRSSVSWSSGLLYYDRLHGHHERLVGR
jgi:hypothetical protein